MDRSQLVKRALLAVHASGLVVRDVAPDVAHMSQQTVAELSALKESSNASKRKKIEYAILLKDYLNDITESCAITSQYLLEALKKPKSTSYLGITLDNSVRPPVYKVAAIVICKPANRIRNVYHTTRNASAGRLEQYEVLPSTINYGNAKLNGLIGKEQILEIDVVCSDHSNSGKGIASVLLGYVLAVQSTRKVSGRFKYKGVLSFLVVDPQGKIPLKTIAERLNWAPIAITSVVKRGDEDFVNPGPYFHENYGVRWGLGRNVSLQVWTDISPSWWTEVSEVLPSDGLIELCPLVSKEGRSYCR